MLVDIESKLVVTSGERGKIRVGDYKIYKIQRCLAQGI